MPDETPAPPAAPVTGGGGPPDWRKTLTQEFDACCDVLNEQIARTSVADPAWNKLHDQRQQYWDAVTALQGSAIDGLLAKVPDATAKLQDAAKQANAAATQIQAISNAVGLAASLLALATAIATAAATGNPGNIVPAAQGVITAANKIIAPKG